MRVAILCNDRLGFPAIHQMLPHKIIVALGTTNRVTETRMALQQLSAMGDIPLEIFTRQNLDSQLTGWLDLHKPDVVLVKTFPYKIPNSVLTQPKYGFVNFHYAPLPEFRGSNPLFWMIKDGVHTGGVTIHQMNNEFDTGDILLQHKVSFPLDSNFGMAVSILAQVGAGLTGPLLQGIQTNTLIRTLQDSSKAKWYGRPKPEDLFIRWDTMSSEQVLNLIKACNPWNKGAIARFQGWTFAISDGSISNYSVVEGTAPGSVLACDENTGLLISCKDEVAIKVDVIYAEEGYFAGARIKNFGIDPGTILD